MAQESSTLAAKRYAVVTGGNKGIGFEICKQLASNGILVILTARDEIRGLGAVQEIKNCSGIPPDHVIFHQLDVVDPISISALADFVRTQFGKLDILVNNAGIFGIQLDGDAFRRTSELIGDFPAQEHWKEIGTQDSESVEECLKINYYGAKHTTEALLPLLLLSDSARIVNVSSSLGLLMHIPNGWAKTVLSDEEKLDEDKIEQILNEFLKDFKVGSWETKGWPTDLSAYVLAKASMNAYTRLLAKKYSAQHQDLCINCLCPGYCKTDITANAGILTATEGAQNVVRLALLPARGPTGCFFSQNPLNSAVITYV